MAAGVDLLIHDAQYSSEEYPQHIGWGHSAMEHALKFAALARAKHLVPFHHDPAHTDDDLDRLVAAARAATNAFAISPGAEGSVFEVA